MADATTSVNSAVTAGDNATAKNPFADTPTTNPSDPATQGVSKPLTLTPDVHEAADNSASTANGGDGIPPIAPDAPAASVSHGNGVNGSGPKFESLVPEETKQPSAPAPSAAEDAAPGGSSSLAKSPVMAGALGSEDPSNSKASVPDQADSAAKDGVEDIAGASSVPKSAVPTQVNDIKGASAGSTTTSDDPVASAEANSSSAASKPSALNGDGEKDGIAAASTNSAILDEKKDPEKSEATGSTALPSTTGSSATAPAADAVQNKDVEMPDAAPISASEKPPVADPTAVPVTAPVTDTTGMVSTTGVPAITPALATPSTAVAEATGGKRKAETDAEGDAGEPAAKKQKGAFSRAMDKAKEAVKEVKEKAKPGRKPGKREKKQTAPAPVGRTERKTRSQARAE